MRSHDSGLMSVSVELPPEDILSWLEEAGFNSLGQTFQSAISLSRGFGSSHRSGFGVGGRIIFLHNGIILRLICY